MRWSEELSFRGKLAHNGPSGLKAQRLVACGLRLAACGLRLAACGLRLAACGLRLAAHSPRRPSDPEARWPSPYSRHFFSSAVNPSSCTDIHSNIILFDPFPRCMLLSERRCHSLFIHLFTEPDREEVHSQTM